MFNLLLITEKIPRTINDASDYVQVSSLPHPISMFMIGILLVLVIFLFLEHYRLKNDYDLLKIEFNNHKEDKIKTNELIDSKISDLSKKVDSRVDKAILAIKKAGEKNMFHDKHGKI